MPLTLVEPDTDTMRIKDSRDRPPPVYPGLGGLGAVPNGPVLRALEGLETV